MGELTNVDFILEMANVRSWLASHGEADPEYAAHVSRRGEIEEERRRRVALGHLWITAELSVSPGRLYQLVQRDGNITAVVIANAEQVEGVPHDLGGNPIMTPEQFQERLALERIQTVLASALIPQLAVASSFLQPAQPTVGVPRGGRRTRVPPLLHRRSRHRSPADPRSPRADHASGRLRRASLPPSHCPATGRSPLSRIPG